MSTGRVVARASVAVVGVAVVAAAAFLVVHRINQPKDLDFSVSFKDAKGLQAEAPLVYRGLIIGTVTGVQLTPAGVQANVRVAAAHRRSVYREADFLIEDAEVAGEAGGIKQITMYDRDVPTTPMEDGDIAKGREGQLDRAVGKIEDAGKKAVEDLKEFTDDVRGMVQMLQASPEVQRLQESLDKLLGRSQEMSEEEYDRLVRESLPAMEAQALEIRNRLEREGNTDAAKRFWNSFRSWADDAGAPSR